MSEPLKMTPVELLDVVREMNAEQLAELRNLLGVAPAFYPMPMPSGPVPIPVPGVPVPVPLNPAFPDWSGPHWIHDPNAYPKVTWSDNTGGNGSNG